MGLRLRVTSQWVCVASVPSVPKGRTLHPANTANCLSAVPELSTRTSHNHRHTHTHTHMRAPPPPTLSGVSMTNIACIIFVLCAGFPQADAANAHPFLPFGVRGLFSAASMVFFSFVGFDYLANAAEEVGRAAAGRAGGGGTEKWGEQAACLRCGECALQLTCDAARTSGAMQDQEVLSSAGMPAAPRLCSTPNACLACRPGTPPATCPLPLSPPWPLPPPSTCS